jgi:2,4-dienoyl-CoA reductase-like NADH-dependent reductase (Old Yellow Enzyme family)
MAPLTRNRADRATDAPYELNARYYAQRASAGLLITEASQISREGQGYIWTPGIYTPEQIAGWRKVTDAVHAAGGRIVIQLWHVGRVSHTSLQENGAAPVAPSAIRAKAQTYIETGFADVSEPRALRLDEIPRVVADYERAARNAKEAGFDGIEIHAANGYLLDQFLSDASNRRTDAYGGSIENRSRLTLEVVEAVLRVWEPGRVGIRLSPGPTNDVVDSNPAPSSAISWASSTNGSLPTSTSSRLRSRGSITATCAGPSGASTSPMAATPASGRSRRSSPGASMPWPSGGPSSPIRTSFSGFASTRPSTSPTAPPSTAAGRRATSTTRRWTAPRSRKMRRPPDNPGDGLMPVRAA